MSDIPKLEKMRELLAPKVTRNVGTLGKIALAGGIAWAGLGTIPQASLLPKATPEVRSVQSPASGVVPLVLQSAETQATLAGHASHSSHASHASHASHHSSSFA